MSYDHILEHLTMLRDQVRTAGYQQAIREVVRPGDRVLDFGCGTGVLSIFAAKAGASVVYAVDRSRMLGAAKQIAADNGCEAIRFVAAEGDQVELPSQVDVLVSEWMGHFLFAEPMLGPLLQLRDRYLAPGGRMIPARCSLHVALVSARARHDELAFLQTNPYGIDFRAISAWPLFEVVSQSFAASDLLPWTACIGTLDLERITAMPDALSGQIKAEQAATCYGLCGWFDAELSAGLTLSTSPFAARTHWKQFFFPFDRALELASGEVIDLELRPIQIDGVIAWRWRASTASQKRSGDNLVHAALLARDESQARRA